MEAAAVFAVARRRGIDAASLFVVSDYLGPDDCHPKFHLTGAELNRLGDNAIDPLAGEPVHPERQH